MPAQPITLGGLHFRKKGDAVDYLQAMLNRYELGDRVSAADAQILRAALDRHPESRAKVGEGITHFSVRSAEFGTRCFWLNRADGSTEDFSFRACIYDRRDSNR